MLEPNAWLLMSLKAEHQHDNALAVYRKFNFRGDEGWQVLKWVGLRSDFIMHSYGRVPINPADRHLVVPDKLYAMRNHPHVGGSKHLDRKVPRLWWKLYTRSRSGDPTTMALQHVACVCGWCQTTRFADDQQERPFVRALLELVKTAAMRCDLLEDCNGCGAMHHTVARDSWLDTLFATNGLPRAMEREAVLVLRQIVQRIQKMELFVRPLQRMHIEERRMSDGAIHFAKQGSSGLMFHRRASQRADGGRDTPMCALRTLRGYEFFGPALRDVAQALHMEDAVVHGGLPWVAGTVFVPQTALDATVVREPWSSAAAARAWQALFTRTGLLWAAPLAWASSIVDMRHRHASAFRHGEHVPDMLRFLAKVRAGRSQARGRGCGPWKSSTSMTCPAAAQTFVVSGRWDGCCLRFETWHPFADSCVCV